MRHSLYLAVLGLSGILVIGPRLTVADCVGDCSHQNMVSIADILTMVNIALGSTPVSDCTAGDANGDHMITVNEILAAVANALNGCPETGGATPTPAAGCHANTDCTNPMYPYCGPNGACWRQPCADVCSDGKNCCGGSYPYCGPNDSCWSAPCATLCGSTCCSASQTCVNNTSCTAGGPTPTPTPAAGCHANTDCTNPMYPYCGPNGACWTQPCADVCSGGKSCCGGSYPYCGPDGSCWSAPCATLCGSTCCSASQMCQNKTSCA